MRILACIAAALIGLMASACDGEVAQPAPAELALLERGTAEINCERESEVRRERILDITSSGLARLILACQIGDFAIFYEGEIDRSFAQMISNLARLNPTGRHGLFVHSNGGDVEAALDVGDIIAGQNWTIFVARTGERNSRESTAICYSACVFLLAAGRERIVLGRVAIHRLYPSRSTATSRQELARALADIVERAHAFMRENGVNETIIAEMMTIPSAEVRVLSHDELDGYGLGRENVAQVDLERLNLERRCGEAFVARLYAVRRAVEATCELQLRQRCDATGGRCSAAANAAMDACVNRINIEHQFPDPICPNDGPHFYCADGRIARSCS